MTLLNLLRSLGRERRGNFAMGTAIALPILFGLVGGSVDLLVHHNHKRELQDAADAAVLAATREASVKGWSHTTAASLVDVYLEQNLRSKYAGGVEFAYEVNVDEKKRRVSVELSQDHYGYFYLGYFTGSPQIRVISTAALTGYNNICILVKEPAESEALNLNGDSSISAKGCTAYSNSAHPKGLSAGGSTELTTQLTCSVGGYAGSSTNYSPTPLTDCPSFTDPLASRASALNSEFGSAACTSKKLKVSGGKKTLTPGVYCGGLTIEKGASVLLEKGVYVIKDGKLKINEGATIEGSEISFVFIGKDAVLELKNESTVSLTAPKTGSTAGLLMYAQSTGKTRTFKIESKNARQLIGTVYLPEERLIVGGDKDRDGICDPDTVDDDVVVEEGGSAGSGSGELCTSDVGSSSAWTVIIAKRLSITHGARLVLNADYGGSDVPVPHGLGPTSAAIRLTR